MWLDDMDVGGRGICRPAVGPLGRALRGARQHVFMSQETLARAAGVHQTQVSRLELGAANWALFCRLINTIGGEPVVTIQPLVAERDPWARVRGTVW